MEQEQEEEEQAIENDTSDWDFDFSQYEAEGDDKIGLKSILEIELAEPTLYSSRFTNDMIELKKIGMLGVTASKLGIKIAARKKDLPLIKEYYGVLNETWGCIKVIAGARILKEINSIDIRCIKLINASSSTRIKEDVYKYLLFYRDTLNRYKQVIRLGISVELKRKSGGRKARHLITE